MYKNLNIFILLFLITSCASLIRNVRYFNSTNNSQGSSFQVGDPIEIHMDTTKDLLLGKAQRKIDDDEFFTDLDWAPQTKQSQMFLVSGTNKGNILLWKIAFDAGIPNIRLVQKIHAAGRIISLAWSPNGANIAAGLYSESKKVVYFGILPIVTNSNGDRRIEKIVPKYFHADREITYGPSSTMNVIWDSTGKILATSKSVPNLLGTDINDMLETAKIRNFHLWKIGQGSEKLLKEIDFLVDEENSDLRFVSKISWSPNSKYFVVPKRDRKLSFWKFHKSESLDDNREKLITHKVFEYDSAMLSDIYELHWSTDGKFVLVNAQVNMHEVVLSIWKVVLEDDKVNLLPRPKYIKSSVLRTNFFSTSWSPNSKYVSGIEISVKKNFHIQIWDHNFNENAIIDTNHTPLKDDIDVWRAKWGPRSDFIASSGGSKTIKLWPVTYK